MSSEFYNSSDMQKNVLPMIPVITLVILSPRFGCKEHSRLLTTLVRPSRMLVVYQSSGSWNQVQAPTQLLVFDHINLLFQPVSEKHLCYVDFIYYLIWAGYVCCCYCDF